jgi:hypothetical protein
MKWMELYRRIDSQNIGHIQRNDVYVFVDDKKYTVSTVYENGKLIGLKCKEVQENG